MTGPPHRHLAAVMFTDIVGYTALMQRDEATALTARTLHRRALEDGAHRHRGRIAQFLGDGSLTVFPSSLAATSAALDILDDLSAHPTVALRIGIHEGDVAYDEQGIYGDAINVAARLENMAQPRTVCVSGKVHDEIKNHRPFATELLGVFELKNVEHPVPVYRVERRARARADLRLLGGAALRVDGELVTGRGAQRRRTALLALLAAAPHGVMSRDRVIGTLWPDHEGQRARRLLSESLYVLRKALGEDCIRAIGDDLSLNEEVVACDVRSFNDAVDRGDLVGAVALYGGPFLDGFYVDDAADFERWASAERQRLSGVYAHAQEALARQAFTEGRYDAAVARWRSLLDLDPLDTTVAVEYMEALEAAGHRARALDFAREHARLLREEYDAEPSPTVEALAARLRDSPSQTAGGIEGALEPDTAQSEGRQKSAGAPPPGPAGPPYRRAGSDSAARVTAAGVPLPSPAPTTPGEAPTTPARSLWRSWPAFAMGGVAAAALFTWFLGPGSGSTPSDPVVAGGASEPAAVVVYPFLYRGPEEGRSLWVDGLPSTISHRLDGVAGLRTIPFLTVVGRTGLPDPSSPLTVEEAEAIARQFDGHYFVMGDVSPLGERVSARVWLFEVGRTSQALQNLLREAPRDSVQAVADSLAREILPTLSTGAGDIRLAASQATESVDALRAFFDGDVHFLDGRYEQAEESFARAVAADPDFALAYHRLSMTQEWNHHYDAAATTARQAAGIAGTLGTRERLLARAWADFLLGDPESAVAGYRRVLEDSEHDVEALYGLAMALLFYNPLLGKPRDEAGALFEELRTTAPAFRDVKVHLMEFAAASGSWDRLEVLGIDGNPESRQAEAWRIAGDLGWPGREPEVGWERNLGDAHPIALGLAVAVRLAFFGDRSGAHRLAGFFSEGPKWDRSWRAVGDLMQAQVALAGGQVDAAAGKLRDAAAGDSAMALELRALYSGIPPFSDSAAVAEVYRDLQAWNPRSAPGSTNLYLAIHNPIHGVLHPYLLGLLATWMGEPAERVGEHVRALDGFRGTPSNQELARNLERSLRAHLAWREGDADQALRLLDGMRWNGRLHEILVSPFYSRPHDRLLRARILADLDRLPEAAGFYQGLVEGFDFPYLGPALLGLGEVRARMGQDSTAAASYRRFADLWIEADAPFRPLVETASSRATDPEAGSAPTAATPPPPRTP